MKFLVGILGAVVFAAIAALIFNALDWNFASWVEGAIFGAVGFVGFSIVQAIYGQAKKKGE